MKAPCQPSTASALSAPGAAGRWLLSVHLLLSPLLFSRYTTDSFEYPKVLLLDLAALALLGLGLSALAWWLQRTACGQRLAGLGSAVGGLARDPLVLGGLLYTLSAALSTITSVSPRTSLWGAHQSDAGLGTVVAYLVLFLATRGLVRGPGDGRRLLAAGVVAGTAAAAYSLVQVGRADPVAWETTSSVAGFVRPFATLGHPNLLGGYLVMSLPLVAALAVRSRQLRRWGALAALLAVGSVMAAAILLSLSRGVWLALLCVTPFVVVGLDRRWRRRAVLGAAALAGGAVLTLVVASQVGGTGFGGGFAHRINHLCDGEGRWEIWRAGLQLFREHPLTGCGLDTFQLAFRSKRTPEYWLTEWDQVPLKAHNEAIHVLATQGLLGGLAVLTLTGGLLLNGVRAWRRTTSEDRPLLLAVCASLVAFYVQNLFGFTVVGSGTLFVTFAAVLSRLAWPPPLESVAGAESGRPGARLLLPGAGALGLLLILGNWLPAQSGTSLGLACLALGGLGGLALFGVLASDPLAADSVPGRAEHGDPVGGAPRARRQAPVFLGLLQAGASGGVLLAAVALVLRPCQADVACASGDRLVEDEPERALGMYEEAVALAPWQEYYWAQLAAGAEAAAGKAREAGERRRLLEQSRRALGRAVELVPVEAVNHANLGRLLGTMAFEKLATPEEALREFDRAVALDPVNACFLADAGQTALALGRLPQAGRYLLRGLEVEPRSAPLRARLGALELAQGRPAQAIPLLEKAVHSDWHGDVGARLQTATLLDEVYLTVGRYDAARQMSGHILDARPGWALPRFFLARSLELLGRDEEALAEYRILVPHAADCATARQVLARAGALASDPVPPGVPAGPRGHPR